MEQRHKNRILTKRLYAPQVEHQAVNSTFLLIFVRFVVPHCTDELIDKVTWETYYLNHDVTELIHFWFRVNTVVGFAVNTCFFHLPLQVKR